MIPIQLWRARIGLYNCRRFSSTAALSVSSPSHCCDHFYCHNRKRWKILLDNNTNVDSTPRSSLQSSLPRPLVLLLLVAAAILILVTSCINSVPATSDRPIVELMVDPHEYNMCDSLTSLAQHQSERFALILLKEGLFVEKHLDSDKKKFFRSVLRDWLSRDDNKPSAAVSHTQSDTNVSVSQAGQNGAALVNSTCVRDSCSTAIIHVSHQLLVLSGDVELNPGPKHRIDDKPKMYDLQCMSYTGEDGKATDFRLKERILRNWRDFAHALRFPLHVIESIKPGEDPVEHLLTKWLQGTNNTEDPRPITWGTLIAALRHANFQQEANILEKHFIQVDTDSAQSGEEDDGTPPKKKQKLAHSSKDLSTHQSASEERVKQLREEIKAVNTMKISQLEAEIAALTSNLTTREKLLKDTLDDILQHAQKLKEKALLNVRQNPDTGLPTSPSPLDNFTAYLKTVYLNTKLRHVFLEPNDKQFSPPFNIHECSAHECCMFGMAWTIGKLSTIDIGNPSYRLSNLSYGRGLSQPKLAFSPEPAKNILVVHPPGSGASLLCYEWAKGELLQRWPVVIRVQLHEKVIREDKDVLNLVYHPEQTVREAVVQKLVESKGREVLFILDGYDQLSGKQKQACFVFHELVMRKHFPQVTLMVLMSQCSQHPQHDQEVKALPEKFHQKIDQYIKILKFSDDDVHQYATDICNDDQDLKSALNSFLSSRSFSYFQLYTPLQCTILTDLYRFHWKNGNKSFAPRTRTELYTDLVRTLLVQYLSSHSEYSKREWHIVEFTDLPGEVYEQFKALAQLAARGIQERVYVFDSGVPEESLGLIYQVEEVYPGRSRSVSYSFLYLTLQEYLAAYYCSLEDPEDQLKQVIGLHNPLRDFLSLHGNRSLQYHWQVVLFTVGITKLSWNADDLQLILRTCDRSRQAQFITGSMCLLYETQSPELIESALSFQQSTTEDKYLELEWVAKTPHELFIAGYCIPHSNRLWEYAHIATQFKDLFKGLSMSSSNNGGRIANLQVTTQQLIMLLSLMPSTSATQKIAKVTICGSNISECFDTCSKLSLCFPHLEELEVSADFSDYLLQLFIVLPEMKSLQKLCITFGNNWQTENMCAICERLQACQVKHLVINHACHAHGYYTYFSSNFMISCKLESLLLSHVTLGPELARCVGMESTALHKLTLHNCDIPNNACSALVDSIKSPHCVLETIALSPVISHDLLKALGSSSSSLKRCILSLDYTLELPHLNSGLKGNKTLEELTVLHVHRNTGMLFVSEIGMLNEAAVKPFMELIRMVDEHTSIRLLTVSSTKYNLQGFSSARNLTKNCRKTLEVQFVD